MLMQNTSYACACSFVHNIHLLRVAQFVSKHKGKGIQTCSIDTSWKDLIKVAIHIGL